MNFIKDVFNEFVKDRCTTLAASLAFYTVFALPPLLYLLTAVVTLGLTMTHNDKNAQKEAQEVIEQRATEMIGNEAAAEEIASILESEQKSSGKWWKTLISFAGILIGATGLVAAIQDSLNVVWSVKPDPESSGLKNVITKRLLSLAMILGLGFLMFLSLILSTVLSAIGDQVSNVIGMSDTIAYLIDFAMQVLIAAVFFAAIFKFMPDAEISGRDVAVGTLATTVLFLLGRYGLQLYLSYSNPAAQLSSAAASFAIILIWVYYSSMIFLLGAEVTQVYATRSGRGIVPEEGAVRVDETVNREN